MISTSPSDVVERSARSSDPIGVSWLITVRWTTLLACAVAVIAVRSALQVPVPVVSDLVLVAACALSNVWLTWRVSAHGPSSVGTAAGWLVSADVVLLSWLLLKSGGILNPASVLYLVNIVVVALVLGRAWTWIVTALSVAGYAALFLAPTEELQAAQSMHPEIALHMRGMWLAFAVTALIIGVLVTRLAVAIERRDRALDVLHDRSARAARAAGLATLAAGAAHELSTPLATIAVAARELERALAAGEPPGDLERDARLIRAETDRCRQILEAMAGQSGEPTGDTPRAASLGDVMSAVRSRLTAAEISHLDVDVPADVRVVWPVHAVARALSNLVQNALQASTLPARVDVRANLAAEDVVGLTIVDRGVGMSPTDLGRAGEPFFTTKAPGAGTGLGLFVARSSIEQLGGRLSLSSVLGRGTVASVTLPRNVVAREAGHHA
jgi:two-component system sensor histidine kinase RegB